MTTRQASPAGVRWVVGLAVVGAVLFTAALVVQVRCAVGECPTPAVRRLLDLDGIGGLPRMFTTGLFVVAAVLAGLAAVRTSRTAALWWAGVAAGCAGVAFAKAVSSHSALERDDGRYATLALGVVLAAVGLVVLWRAGRAWGVPAAPGVALALAAYAAAALGLDEVTAGVVALTSSPVALAVATYVEEGGEAVAALVVLAVVARWVPLARQS